MPVYRTWLADIIKADLKIKQQLKFMNEEGRKKVRWGVPYKLSKQIYDYFIRYKINVKEVIVLLPPNELMKRNALKVSIPEPVVFYYYTGIKAKWANSPGAEDANYFVNIQNGEVIIAPVKSVEELNAVLSEFRQYDITL